MKNISMMITQRGNVHKFIIFMYELCVLTLNPASVEILVAIDDNDEEFLAAYKELEKKHWQFSLKFYVVPQSEHFTKDYWNFLARRAEGRFMIPICCDNKILTMHWDKILYEKMDSAAAMWGDDYLLGLTKDNIKRTNENPVYPNFSCHPVLSKEYVSKMGYFFDERYWSWGADQAAAILFRKLSSMIGQQRLVSIMDVMIYDYNSMHTTDETDPKKLEAMRLADSAYQKHLRISQEHPCTLSQADYEAEARKIMELIHSV